MPFQAKQIIPIIFTFLAVSMIGCGDSEFKNPCAGSWISRCGTNTEILIIGPYRTECPSFSGSDCYLEYNEENQRWFFFYDGIKGFDFEPGFIWTLEVSLHEYKGDIQDVGKYEYRLVEILNKEPAPVDEKPPRKP